MNFLNKILRRKKEMPAPLKKAKEENMANVAQKSVPVETKAGEKRAVVGIVRSPHTTEKSSASAARNAYVFKVSPDANKIQVRRAVESRYGVHVEQVRMSNSPRKERRRGKQIGWKPGFKKAMVQIKEGQTIEIQ